MKRTGNAVGSLFLIMGDVIAYLFSLVLTLGIRYLEVPSRPLVEQHLIPFVVLTAIFLVVNFSAGLYNKQTVLMRKRLPSLIVKAQIINILISAAFFYVASVGIAPKVNLIIYAVVSTAVLYLWRIIMLPVMSSVKNQPAIILGDNTDLIDLEHEINEHAQYGIKFIGKVAPNENVEVMLEQINRISGSNSLIVIVADLGNPLIEKIVPNFYRMIFAGTQIIDAARLYESVFDRIPLAMVREKWLVENAALSIGTRKVYEILKRLTDIFIAVVLGLVSLLIYPFVWIAMKTEDNGPLFIKQIRVGRGGKLIEIYKFRSMRSLDGEVHNDSGNYENGGRSNLVVTKVGRIIRMTRIDELPQLFNILKGDISLIGPRPELPNLVSIYDKEIPHYNVRHLIKPGLSGWAQIYHETHPHHSVAIDETRDKLSYDLYYVKNRSFSLDIRIALQTIRSLLSRRGA